MKASKLLIALLTLLISMSVYAQTSIDPTRSRGMGLFGYQFLTSEVTKTDSKFWYSTACYGSVVRDGLKEGLKPDEIGALKPGPLKHVFTHVGAVKDYVPQTPTLVPNVDTRVRVRGSLTYIPLAEKDGKFDKKALRRLTDEYLKKNNIDQKSDFAQRIYDAFDKGEAPNFVLYAQAVGLDNNSFAPAMEWQEGKNCFEGMSNVSNVEPDLYHWVFSYGFRGLRERIKLSIPIYSELTGHRPTVNRPSSEMAEGKDAADFVICNGTYFTGINCTADLWKVTVYTRRSTFSTHEGTSWSEADTSGGYLEAIPVPPGFKPGQPIDLIPNGGNGGGGGTTPKTHRLCIEVIETKRDDGQTYKVVRITCDSAYKVTVTYEGGEAKDSDPCTNKNRLCLVLKEYPGADKFVVSVGGDNSFSQTLDFAKLQDAEVGTKWEFDK